jgi:hypothetical protein
MLMLLLWQLEQEERVLRLIPLGLWLLIIVALLVPVVWQSEHNLVGVVNPGWFMIVKLKL